MVWFESKSLTTTVLRGGILPGRSPVVMTKGGKGLPLLATTEKPFLLNNHKSYQDIQAKSDPSEKENKEGESGSTLQTSV